MVRCEDKSDEISIDSFIYWYSNIQSQSLTKEHTTAKLRNRYGFTYVDIRDSIVEAIVSGLYVRECCFCLNNRKKKTEISTPAKDCDIIVEERELHSRTIKLTCTIYIFCSTLSYFFPLIFIFTLTAYKKIFELLWNRQQPSLTECKHGSIRLKSNFFRVEPDTEKISFVI